MPHAQASGFPPRTLDLRENRTPAKAVSRSDRGLARDRPSPYGEREVALQTVVRGPVPRDLPRARWSGEGQAFALRVYVTRQHEALLARCIVRGKRQKQERCQFRHRFTPGFLRCVEDVQRCCLLLDNQGGEERGHLPRGCHYLRGH